MIFHSNVFIIKKLKIPSRSNCHYFKEFHEIFDIFERGKPILVNRLMPMKLSERLFQSFPCIVHVRLNIVSPFLFLFLSFFVRELEEREQRVISMIHVFLESGYFVRKSTKWIRADITSECPRGFWGKGL